MAIDLAKIVDQTCKLVRLATNNPSDAEATSAARKACTLIAAYALSISVPAEPPPQEWPSSSESPPPTPAPADDVLNDIEDMQASGEFSWASETLDGIYTWVNDHQRVTTRQWQAVQNIKKSRGW